MICLGQIVLFGRLLSVLSADLLRFATYVCPLRRVCFCISLAIRGNAQARAPCLTHLCLRQNQLASLALDALVNLVALDVSHNRLARVGALRQARRLRVLRVAHNRIAALSDIDALLALAPRLAVLELHGNLLSLVPDVLARCGQLRQLRVDAAQLPAALQMHLPPAVVDALPAALDRAACHTVASFFARIAAQLPASPAAARSTGAGATTASPTAGKPNTLLAPDNDNSVNRSASNNALLVSDAEVLASDSTPYAAYVIFFFFFFFFFFFLKKSFQDRNDLFFFVSHDFQPFRFLPIISCILCIKWFFIRSEIESLPSDCCAENRRALVLRCLPTMRFRSKSIL